MKPVNEMTEAEVIREIDARMPPKHNEPTSGMRVFCLYDEPVTPHTFLCWLMKGEHIRVPSTPGNVDTVLTDLYRLCDVLRWAEGRVTPDDATLARSIYDQVESLWRQQR